MPAKRCPNCQALNAEEAQHCAMCGERLMADVQEQSDGSPVIMTDAGRWVGPNVPAPGGARLARDATQRRQRRRPTRPVRARRAVPRVVYVLAGLGMGAVIGAMLVFVAGLIDQFAFRGQAHSQPAMGISGLPPFASGIATGAVLGGVTGGLVGVADSPWVGLGVFAALFMILEGWTLPGGGLGVVQGSLVVAAAGVWGAAYGYLIAIAVRGLLEEILARPSDG